MDFSTLTLERRGAVEILSLNRPEALNAMSPEMVSEMRAYFDGLLARLDVRVVLLRGEGRMFSAGADLGSVAFTEAGEGRAQRQMAMQKLYSGLGQIDARLSAADHRAPSWRRVRRRLLARARL